MTGVEAHFSRATQISVLISTCNRFLEETVSVRKVGYPAFGLDVLFGKDAGACRSRSPFRDRKTRARAGSRWGPRKSSPDNFVEFRTRTARSARSLDPPECQNPASAGLLPVDS